MRLLLGVFVCHGQFPRASIALIAAKRSPADLAAGLCDSIAGRIAALAMSVTVTDDVYFAGGVGKMSPIVNFVARRLNTTILQPSFDPQLLLALGAAQLGVIHG